MKTEIYVYMDLLTVRVSNDGYWWVAVLEVDISGWTGALLRIEKYPSSEYEFDLFYLRSILALLRKSFDKASAALRCKRR